MLINRNNFMKFILLSTITFGIAFACTVEEKKAACYNALTHYCDITSDEEITINTQCAKRAIITYSQDQEQSTAVQKFFAEVIFPKTANRDIIPPSVFCNIRNTTILEEYKTRRSSFRRWIGVPLQPLFEEEMYLLKSLKKKLKKSDEVQKCLSDTQEFRDNCVNEGEETMLQFAMLSIAKSKFDNGNIYGKIYLEYTSKTITNVDVANPDTDTPRNFCNRFDYENNVRATA